MHNLSQKMSSTAMSLICGSYLLVLLCTLTSPVTASWGSLSRGSDRDELAQEQKLLQMIRDVKRRTLFDNKYACARWGDPCDPWSDKPFLECCDDDRQTCKCNLWGQNCWCKSKLFGR